MDRDSRPYCRLPRHESSAVGTRRGIVPSTWNVWDAMLVLFPRILVSQFRVSLGSTILVLLGKQDT